MRKEKIDMKFIQKNLPCSLDLLAEDDLQQINDQTLSNFMSSSKLDLT